MELTNDITIQLFNKFLNSQPHGVLQVIRIMYHRGRHLWNCECLRPVISFGVTNSVAVHRSGAAAMMGHGSFQR